MGKVNFKRGTSQQYASKVPDNDTIYFLTDTNEICLGSEKYSNGIFVVSTTYANLVTLRNNEKLIPGQKYRIVDYVTKINGTWDLSDYLVTTAYFHYAKSAEHEFDLIVTAISKNELDEHAKATLHANDTYFADSNLDAWDIKYSLDNDNTKYSWADTASGKGVIYYMKDEFNNEAGYDFKNVQFVAYALKAKGQTTGSLVYNQNTQPRRYGSVSGLFQAIINYLTSGTFTTVWAEYDFAVGNDILNAITEETLDASYLSTYNAGLYYTFDGNTGSGFYESGDASLNHTDLAVFENKIADTSDFVRAIIPDIVSDEYIPLGLNGTHWQIGSISSGISNGWNITACNVEPYAICNILSDGCTSINLGKGSYGNLFGKNAYNNTLGSDCTLNIFEPISNNGAYSNILGNNCSNNIYNGTYQVTIGNNCTSNKFWTRSHRITIGDDCSNNNLGGSNGVDIILGNNCTSNVITGSVVILEHDCSNNQIGGYNNYLSEYSSHNAIGNNSQHNHLGPNCTYFTINTYCNNNRFEASCTYITLNNYCSGNVFGAECDHVTLDTRTLYCSIGKTVKYVTLAGPVSPTATNAVAYYHIYDGVHGTSNNVLTINGTGRDPSTIIPELHVSYDTNSDVFIWNPADIYAGQIQTSYSGSITVS